MSTLGSLLNLTKGRTISLNLSELRVFVLDEADSFFLEESRRLEILQFNKILRSLSKPIQYLFFSTTYDELVSEEISKLIDEAN